MSMGARIFARFYDSLMAGPEAAGLHDYRRALLARATGEVLEVGAGTGLNLSAYDDAACRLTLTEPQQPMMRRLERRLRESGTSALVLRAPAEDLPFPEASFDVVVSTLVLCTVDDQPRTVRELRRVLRPTGRLLFLEHVRALDAGLARWQDRINRVHRALSQGCNCNRPTLDTLEANGFVLFDVEHTALPMALPWVRPLVIGSAARE